MASSRRDRSRSPRSREHQSSRSSRARDEIHKPRLTLPYSARELTKHDLSEYKPMFASYLDIQKRIDLDELSEDEVRGRWKSFINKWNRRELAEGWHDPSTLIKARRAAEDSDLRDRIPDIARGESTKTKPSKAPASRDDDDDEDDYGPALPSTLVSDKVRSHDGPRSGPTVPRIDDLRSRNEDKRADLDQAREQRLEAMRQARQTDRKVQKDRLEEIAPRADAGTRERQMEKKQDVAASNRAFAASKDAGNVDVPESDVMGGDDLGELKRLRKEQDRRKTERELKREEILRAKTAEREERSARLRAKEEKTMTMLRELARSRFGDGNVQPAALRD